MANFYFNPATRTGGIRQTITCIHTTDACYESEKRWYEYATKAGSVYRDPFKQLAPTVVNTIEELCELMKEAGFSGGERFIDKEGNLYSIGQLGAFEIAPLEHNGQLAEGGINWATRFFFTEEAAIAFGKSLNAGRSPEDGYFRWDKPRYHEDLDTWDVHYHCYAD